MRRSLPSENGLENIPIIRLIGVPSLVDSFLLLLPENSLWIGKYRNKN